MPGEQRKRNWTPNSKQVKQQLDELEEASCRSSSRTVSSINDGRRPHPLLRLTDIYASPLNDREEVVAALKQSELGQYVAENYNTNSAHRVRARGKARGRIPSATGTAAL